MTLITNMVKLSQLSSTDPSFKERHDDLYAKLGDKIQEYYYNHDRVFEYINGRVVITKHVDYIRFYNPADNVETALRWS